VLVLLAAVWVLPLPPVDLVPEGDTVVVTPDVAVTDAVEVLPLATEEKLETELVVTLGTVPLTVGGPV
jgi:hypothetical protein